MYLCWGQRIAWKSLDLSSFSEGLKFLFKKSKRTWLGEGGEIGNRFRGEFRI